MNNSELVWSMIGDDVNETRRRMNFNAAEKWNARKEQREPELIPKIQYPNYLKGIPNEWCQILKQQCRLCQICKNSNTNVQHTKEHNIIRWIFTSTVYVKRKVRFSESWIFRSQIFRVNDKQDYVMQYICSYNVVRPYAAYFCSFFSVPHLYLHCSTLQYICSTICTTT